MEYVKIKNADRIVKDCPYVVNNPKTYKGKWNQFFQNGNPICLELGMGRGDFIIEMARKYPNINFIGLEAVDSQMVPAVQHLRNEKLANLKLICGDAMEIDQIFQKEIDTIYLTFCDPWPKKHDDKKRFTHINYLKKYDKVFKKQKHIILKTDNKGFFAYSLETLSNYWYTFKRVSLDLHHDENPIPNVMADYERQYFKEGRPIYYVDARFED